LAPILVAVNAYRKANATQVLDFGTIDSTKTVKTAEAFVRGLTLRENKKAKLTKRSGPSSELRQPYTLPGSTREAIVTKERVEWLVPSWPTGRSYGNSERPDTGKSFDNFGVASPLTFQSPTAFDKSAVVTSNSPCAELIRKGSFSSAFRLTMCKSSCHE
jgi:hypothetical protein